MISVCKTHWMALDDKTLTQFLESEYWYTVYYEVTKFSHTDIRFTQQWQGDTGKRLDWWYNPQHDNLYLLYELCISVIRHACIWECYCISIHAVLRVMTLCDLVAKYTASIFRAHCHNLRPYSEHSPSWIPASDTWPIQDLLPPSLFVHRGISFHPDVTSTYLISKYRSL
jgi:hypothetical protein